MFMHPPQTETGTERINVALGAGLVLLISTWFVLQMGILPQSLLSLAQASVTSIF
jgi:hypothetical protein